MAKIKLTKTIVDAAKPGAQDIELRDTLVPGFLCKVTPTGRKVFMVQYRTNAGERRKPSIGQFGELTVEQARSLAQDLLAEVRHGKDPSSLKAAARQAPTVKELCTRFIEDYSKAHNKPSTVEGNLKYISLHIAPALGGMKVPEVISEVRVLMRHALVNAAVPIVTVIGIGIALLIGGVVVTETVFAIPGLGQLTVDAVLSRDYPLIQAITLFFSFIYVLINLLVDLSYLLLDPRIRY